MRFDPVSLLESARLSRNTLAEWLAALTQEVSLALDPEALGAVGYIVGDQGLEGKVSVPMTALFDVSSLRLASEKAVPLSTEEETAVFKGARRLPGLRSAWEDAVGAGTGECFQGWPQQVADALSFSVLGPGGRTLVVTSLSARRRRIERWERILWHALSIHMSASARLVGKVVDPDELEYQTRESSSGPLGSVLSYGAVPALTQGEAEHLRRAALDLDRVRSSEGRSEPHEALSLWQGLLSGRWSVVDHFDAEGKRFVLARRTDSPPIGRLSQRQRQSLFLAALGCSNQEVAAALGISESTVATHVCTGLSRLGLRSRGELIRFQSTVMAGFNDTFRSAPPSW